jgi:hypothetical protein
MFLKRVNTRKDRDLPKKKTRNPGDRPCEIFLSVPNIFNFIIMFFREARKKATPENYYVWPHLEGFTVFLRKGTFQNMAG